MLSKCVTAAALLGSVICVWSAPASAKPFTTKPARAERALPTPKPDVTDFSARKRRHAQAERRRSAHVKRAYVRHARMMPIGAAGAVVPGIAMVPDRHSTADPFSAYASAPHVAPASARSRSRLARAEPVGGPAISAGGGSLVAEARRYIGGNPTGRGSLWCGHFMNLVLARSGHQPSGSNQARSFASYGTRIAGPQIGAIAVMSRGGGGHVGIVSGIDESGNPIIISGNHNRRVAEVAYPRGRIYAYVMP